MEKKEEKERRGRRRTFIDPIENAIEDVLIAIRSELLHLSLPTHLRHIQIRILQTRKRRSARSGKRMKSKRRKERRR